jgi:hypothetical protein
MVENFGVELLLKPGASDMNIWEWYHIEKTKQPSSFSSQWLTFTHFPDSLSLATTGSGYNL